MKAGRAVCSVCAAGPELGHHSEAMAACRNTGCSQLRGLRAAPSPPRAANHTEGRGHTRCEATQAAAPGICTHQELH